MGWLGERKSHLGLRRSNCPASDLSREGYATLAHTYSTTNHPNSTLNNKRRFEGSQRSPLNSEDARYKLDSSRSLFPSQKSRQGRRIARTPVHYEDKAAGNDVEASSDGVKGRPRRIRGGNDSVADVETPSYASAA
ncbi:hypothetical protein KM043_017255 [Ampulex compressa]|nr:hypothetical protein KM043_017255 [Ampulex compressa]